MLGGRLEFLYAKVRLNATGIAVRAANPFRVTLNKTQIEAIKSSGVSLMPEGIEAQLDQQALADLSYTSKTNVMSGVSLQLCKNHIRHSNATYPKHRIEIRGMDGGPLLDSRRPSHRPGS